MDEQLERNLNIYFQCLTRQYRNNELTPVLEIIYDIVDKFDDDIMCFNNLISDNDVVRNNKSDFINSVINLFTRIVKDNRFNDLARYMEIINKCELSYAPIDYLYIMSYPKECYEESPKNYFEIFQRLTLKFLNTPVSLCVDAKIGYLLTTYKEYVKSFEVDNIDDMNRSTFFRRYGTYILADFYANDFDDISINDLFDYMCDNMEHLREFLALNNDDSVQIDKYIINKIKNNSRQEKKII